MGVQPTAANPPLGIGWRLSPVTGWGVYGMNLAMAMAADGRFSPVSLASPVGSGSGYAPHGAVVEAAAAQYREFARLIGDAAGRKVVCPFPVLHPLGNHLTRLNQLGPDGEDEPMSIAGSPDIGVVFMETPPARAGAVKRAADYAAIVAGSTWNADLLRNFGIPNVKLARQGIDPQLFCPGPRDNTFGDRFVIFSGGKLEYRKAQDIVIAAFRIFHARRPDALLAVSWQNLSTKPLAKAMLEKGHIDRPPEPAGARGLRLAKWLTDNGVPTGSYVDLGILPNYLVGRTIRQADVALFPNRCEGGTNLVAMECMASGVPVILSANTGHLDLIDPERCISLDTQAPVTSAEGSDTIDGWGESDVGEIVDALEMVYADREAAKRRASEAAEFMRDWTWVKQVGRLLDALEGVI